MDWWRSIRGKARTASRLGGGEWLLLAQAWAGIARSRRDLRTHSLERLQARLANLPPSQDARPSLAQAQRLASLMEMAGRLHRPAATCLERALALQHMLARRGMTAALCLGAQGSPAHPHLHAWLEVDGVPLGEEAQALAQFQPLQNAAPQPPSHPPGAAGDGSRSETA